MKVAGRGCGVFCRTVWLWDFVLSKQDLLTQKLRVPRYAVWLEHRPESRRFWDLEEVC